jgi:cell division protein FtsL
VEPPPSPPPPKDWLQTVIENLQKPEIQQLVIIFVVIIVSISGILHMKKRRIFEKGKITREGERTIKDLIKEIENMEKSLKDEREQND